MAASLGGIEALGAHDGDLFELANLPDELLLATMIGLFLVLLALERLTDLLVDHVAQLSVLIFHGLHSLTSLTFLLVHLIDDFNAAAELFLEVLLALIKSHVRLNLHLLGVDLVIMRLLLLCKDGLLTRKLHLDLLALNVVEALNFFALIHLLLPGDELGLITLIPLKVLETPSLCLLGLLEGQSFSLDRRSRQLHLRILLRIKVGHLARLGTRKLQLLLEILFEDVLGLVEFVDAGASLRRQLKALPRIFFIFASDSVGFNLSALFLLFLDVDDRLFEDVLRERNRQYLLCDSLWLRYLFRLGLRQFEWLLHSDLLRSDLAIERGRHTAHGPRVTGALRHRLAELALAGARLAEG